MNVDNRKSEKTQLAELRETFAALQLKYEQDTYELRKELREARKALRIAAARSAPRSGAHF